MEEKNQGLVQELFDNSPRFRMLFEEHRLLEKELSELEDRPYLTPEQEFEKKKMQKLKLAGKDEMERMLAGCRH